jgi:alcohol dehydrogenase
MQSCCEHGGPFGDGVIDGQGEIVRVPFADATLVKVPGSDFTDEQLASFTALSDVMCTGFHAAVSAGVKEGDSVAVVGDGAVGLSAVLSARLLGAGRIVAAGITRAGGMIGAVGFPLCDQFHNQTLFWKNIGLRGGVAPARQYIPELLQAVLEGKINPDRLFDYETDLDHVADAYAAMDERRAIKSLLKISAVQA